MFEVIKFPVVRDIPIVNRVLQVLQTAVRLIQLIVKYCSAGVFGKEADPFHEEPMRPTHDQESNVMTKVLGN